MSVYNLIHDAYYGTGGFAGPYLIKHGRETEDNYRNRIRMAYYMNYFAPIVNALVDPVFKKPAMRDWTGAADTIIGDFLHDVDGAGTDINNFMRRAALQAKLYGGVFIVVENWSQRDQPDNMQDVLEGRKFPYAYMVTPDRVTSCDIDKDGRIRSIRFTEVSEEKDGTEKYRTAYYDAETWQIELDGRIISAGKHGLGMAPVVFFPAQEFRLGEIHPVPEVYPLAQVSVALYNHCSWLTEILRNDTFPILTFPSREATDITIGTNNALCYDGETVKFQPGFIAPPNEPASMLQSQISLLIQEMYRMAGLSFATGTKQETSGIARQWEFERTNQRLSALAQKCKKAEMLMINILMRWINLESTYTVSYPTDYGITDIATEMNTAQAVLDMGFGSEMEIEVAKKVLSVYAADITADRFDEIIDSIKAQKREPDYNNPPGNNA